MKAWRFYGFSDMRMDDVPKPEIRPGHVIAKVLCVQPSVTEAQLAFGIRTLAFDKIKTRLETEAPVQLFGHEFCVRIVETAGNNPQPHLPRCLELDAGKHPHSANLAHHFISG